ncbi:hypothetical protein A8924_4502 [Saccharopolyspora erythraea NRRL 2338]|uniref:Phenazine antibiotic biosynthesis protein n=2 Tax=Saccharopolyspora erythraea TaxID=1836 RepID=A4FH58_SACEN|nr:hypothetical protein [Saccharopolyspora erythraea]PFG97083.1 hypothetical protein A8924_4502 [Saccharopolyspora erythraea NRRL 2338]CAM03383.1 putative phenazine antibiotic biosynthesis protein [Saccharopolyspora erythraea NRRL 2338]
MTSPRTAPGAGPGFAVETRTHLRDVLDWHFDPATGSPFWLSRAGFLDFDPRRDIAGLADLVRFPDLCRELRGVPAEDLIPRGMAGRRLEVFDSGGTSGRPYRRVDAGAVEDNVDWCSGVLDEHGFPEGVNWLHVGPSGPHVVGRAVRYLAARRGGLCFTVDMDPRWLAKLVATGQQETADDYVEHLLDQIEAVVLTQDVRCASVPLHLVDELCARPQVYETLAERLRGLLWVGTAGSNETMSLLRTMFPAAAISGWYGDTVMGIAAERACESGPERPCVFRPYHPASVIQVVDAASREPVGYGQRGRVLRHLLTREAFLPNLLGRDTALRVPPLPGDDVDGIASVAAVGGGPFAEEVL